MEKRRFYIHIYCPPLNSNDFHVSPLIFRKISSCIAITENILKIHDGLHLNINNNVLFLHKSVHRNSTLLLQCLIILKLQREVS
jgi:hypothetical protein